MSTAHKNSNRKEAAKKSADAQSKLQAPWRAHFHVWFFMLTLSMSPLSYLLWTQESIGRADWLQILLAVVLIQGALWLVQQRCSSEDLSYWEGLLVVATGMTAGVGPLSLILAFGVLLLTVTASFVFVAMHNGGEPLRHASIRFSKLIIGIHRRRLYR